MRKFIVIIGLVLASVSISSATNVVEIKGLIASPEQYVGKTITIQGLISFECQKTEDRVLIGQGRDRFGLLKGKKLKESPLDFLNKEVIVTGKIVKMSNPTRPFRCGKCDGKACGQYINKVADNGAYSLYYMEVESIKVVK